MSEGQDSTLQNKDGLRNCHKAKEAKKARQLNVMWNPRWDFGIQKGPCEKVVQLEYIVEFSSY